MSELHVCQYCLASILVGIEDRIPPPPYERLGLGFAVSGGILEVVTYV